MVPVSAPAAASKIEETALRRPRWPAPATVRALMTTRAGGVSRGPWASLNLGRKVGDDADAVAENRRRFAETLAPAQPVWLRQVHGAHVVELTVATGPEAPGEADAAWTRTPGIACIVGAADCLPVLFALRDGRAVAAAHAGWRGLAAGVLEATVRALTQGMQVEPSQVLAWLGPCIGPGRFEVGADVLLAFGAGLAEVDQPNFRYAPRPDGAPRWHADLQGLARHRLQAAGVSAITADAACTYEQASTFFSFRRAAGQVPTGRMAAAVWISAA